MEGNHQIRLVGQAEGQNKWLQASLALLQKLGKELHHLSSLARIMETGSRLELTGKKPINSGGLMLTCHQPSTSRSSWAAEADLKGGEVEPAGEERVEGIDVLRTECN